MNKVRVLIVDDSALMRQLLTAILSSDPSIEVIGSAADPVAARTKIEALRPDVMTLDIEMPKMDGLTFLEQLMQSRPMPVVMVSSLTQQGCDVALRALALGAVDVVAKPKIDVSRGMSEAGTELVGKVKAAARARVRTHAPKPSAHSLAPGGMLRTTQKLIAIGSSTGGTEALSYMLSRLPADAPPIVIVQHMPPVFTRQFAQRLDGICRVDVKEAENGDALIRGRVLIAPGGVCHIEVVRSGAAYCVRFVDGPPIGHHRPSVDVLFESCARVAGPNATGVILTGMGHDGAKGLLAMRKAGATTFAEDESSCVVFGMPKEAIACGAAQHVVPLERMAKAMLYGHETTMQMMEDGR